MKNKNVNLYYPTTINCQYSFWELIEIISQLDITQRIVPGLDSGSNYVIDFKIDANNCIIVLQKLKYDDLPRVANKTDGSNERILNLPDGMSLSFKNIFVLNKSRGILAMPVLSSCPQIGVLRACVKKIMRDNVLDCDHADINIAMIMKTGLAKRLREANEVTMAEFTSKDFNGEDISESRLPLYKEYLSGYNVTKKIRLKGLKGRNLKNALVPILEDVIAHGIPSENLNIKMTINGQDINFSRYYERRTVSVKTDAGSIKSLDYEDLEQKMVALVANYEIDDD